MGCITGFLLLCNIALIIVADILLWMFSATMGLFGLIGVAAFFIGYTFSVEMSIAPRDFWVNPEFDIFIKKLAYANTCALVAWGGIMMIAGFCGNESVMEIIHWASN
ncbi:hypothetical protein [Bacteroides sp. 51]|uniref:hypothetical protein n=1 Tax=Bacteroides sp. 51 TaxID=2302938 RepID=UPI0013D4BB23|nr:hypothetical protein [Bacteroides sp. 51]NDV82471.1 hypothetical protein [Bacteroides sp. 51]